MSVNSVSGGGTPWQILAEQRAARAAATDPASAGAGLSGAGLSGAPTGTAATNTPPSNAVTGSLPQPAASLFQYLAGLHAGHGDGDGDGSGGGAAAAGAATASGGAGASGSTPSILADLQSFLTDLQQAVPGQTGSGTPPQSAATPANGNAAGTTSTSGTPANGAPAGTDLALQMLGLQSYNPAFAMLGATTALSA